MLESGRGGYAALCAAAVVALTMPQTGTAGKIVCWKDASGRTVGCGDHVPAEFRGAATKELDAHGVTRKTNLSAEDAARQREAAAAEAQRQAEEEKRLAEQRRQDLALLATFSNTAEIDAKRERELQTLDLLIRQQQTALKTIADRQHRLEARKREYEKGRKPVPGPIEDDLKEVAEDKRAMEESIASKQKEKDTVRQRYGALKARYEALRGGGDATAKR